MVYGKVPYQSKTIDDLLFDICEIGPSFTHFSPLTNQLIEIPEKLKDLIKSLLHPKSEERINHNTLFSLVLDDSNFEKNYSGLSTQITLSSYDVQEPVID